MLYTKFDTVKILYILLMANKKYSHIFIFLIYLFWVYYLLIWLNSTPFRLGGDPTIPPLF